MDRQPDTLFRDSKPADRPSTATTSRDPTFAGHLPASGPSGSAPSGVDGAAPSSSPVPTEPGDTQRVVTRFDRITLDLKDESGDFGKLRVSIAGSSVRATIVPNDPALADRLNHEIRQLRQSLEERGFPEPRVTVESPRAGDGGVRGQLRDPTGAATGPDGSRESTGQPTDDRRERWTAERHQQGQRQQRQSDQRAWQRAHRDSDERGETR
jgi:hypothetical protein